MTELNRKCKYCGKPLYSESYPKMRRQKTGKLFGVEYIVFCNNDKCPVKPCSDSTFPSKVLEEVKCFEITESEVSE